MARLHQLMGVRDWAGVWVDAHSSPRWSAVRDKTEIGGAQQSVDWRVQRFRVPVLPSSCSLFVHVHGCPRRVFYPIRTFFFITLAKAQTSVMLIDHVNSHNRLYLDIHLKGGWLMQVVQCKALMKIHRSEVTFWWWWSLCKDTLPKYKYFHV